MKAVVPFADSINQTRGGRVLLAGVQIPQEGINVWRGRACYVSMVRRFERGSVTEIGSRTCKLDLQDLKDYKGFEATGPEIIPDCRNGNSWWYCTQKHLGSSDQLLEDGDRRP